MIKLSGFAKIGLVVGGYIAACLISYGIVYIWELLTQGPIAQASSGMYAFGDLILLIASFGFLALFPAGLAIFFMVQKFLNRQKINSINLQENS